jgi:mannose/fructose-specific phosphotransferase system component IIA
VSQVKQQSLQQLKEYQMANMVKVLTEEYISRKSVEGALIFGGTSAVFTVQFVKNNGDLRTITGVNVALMTDDGYKSFNTGAVLSIEYSVWGHG